MACESCKRGAVLTMKAADSFEQLMANEKCQMTNGK